MKTKNIILYVTIGCFLLSGCFVLKKTKEEFSNSVSKIVENKSGQNSVQDNEVKCVLKIIDKQSDDMGKGVLFKTLIFKNLRFFYFWWILLLSLIIRSIMSVFKAFGILQGEADEKGFKYSKEWNWWQAFRRTFRGFGTSIKIDDYWLTVFLGSMELFIWPILINLGKWEYIGAWIGLKVASTWGPWQKTRTAYTRFLCGNLLVLIASLFLTNFVVMY